MKNITILMLILASFKTIAAVTSGSISLDLKNISEVRVTENAEIMSGSECWIFVGRMLENRVEGPCNNITPKKRKISYEQRDIYKKIVGFYINFKDGSQLVSPERTETRYSLWYPHDMDTYPNLNHKAVIKIRAMVADANNTYFNQFGLCYENGADIPLNGDLYEVKSVRKYIDCNIDPTNLIFKKDPV